MDFFSLEQKIRGNYLLLAKLISNFFQLIFAMVKRGDSSEMQAINYPLLPTHLF